MKSPFNFGRTVRNEQFTNRETEIKKLVSNFENGVNTTIISPRRWGKSSLVERAASLIRSKSIKVVHIDLFSIRSEEEFYNALANAVIKCTSSKTDEWMALAKKFLRTISPKFTVELGDKQDFNLELDFEASKKHYKELLNLPEKIAADKKLKLIICIDEFQNIAAFSDPLAIQKRLRSIWQQHEHVSYCLYGSKRHMMIELFSKPNFPFYRFGETIFLKKISAEKWTFYISKQFQKTGKKISNEFALQISNTVKCHPYFVQQLSHLVWINTQTTVDASIIACSVQELIDQNGILYFQLSENLNNSELKLLRAIYAGEKQLSSKDTIATYRLGTSASVIKAKRTLFEREILDDTEVVPAFLDPCFELWFAQNLLS